MFIKSLQARAAQAMCGYDRLYIGRRTNLPAQQILEFESGQRDALDAGQEGMLLRFYSAVGIVFPSSSDPRKIGCGMNFFVFGASDHEAISPTQFFGALAFLGWSETDFAKHCGFDKETFARFTCFSAAGSYLENERARRERARIGQAFEHSLIPFGVEFPRRRYGAAEFVFYKHNGGAKTQGVA